MSSERYEGQTFYDILEIPPTAGVSEIYNAYQKAKVAYSPSSPALYTMFTPQEAQELLRLVEEAFQTLSHQTKRKEYDVKHGIRPAPPMTASTPYQATSSSTSAQIMETLTPAKKTEDGWVGEVKVQRKTDDLPKGHGKTKFGTYQVKPEMEDEIRAANEFDGTFINKVRLYKNVSIEQLADQLRVTKATLLAIEANDLGALPVAVFVRGHVIQIARALNLDERKFTDAYMKWFKAKKLG